MKAVVLRFLPLWFPCFLSVACFCILHACAALAIGEMYSV